MILPRVDERREQSRAGRGLLRSEGRAIPAMSSAPQRLENILVFAAPITAAYESPIRALAAGPGEGGPPELAAAALLLYGTHATRAGELR